MRKLISRTNSSHRAVLTIGAVIALALGSAVACSSDGHEVAHKHQLQSSAWASGVYYAAGELITYDRATYSCVQPHTSLTGWEPPNVPALWTLVPGGTGGSSSGDGDGDGQAFPQEPDIDTVFLDFDCEQDPESCCPYGSQQLTLSEGPDVQHVTASEQCVVSLGGPDTVFLNSTGSSAALLGDGPDTAMLGPGNDLVFAGAGNDTINGYGGTNLLIGGAGDDTITAANGSNTVVPGPGRDTVALGTGDDRVYIFDECEIEAGDTIDGGTGVDTLVSPFTLDELAARGVTVTNFENVVVQHLECHSECTPNENCEIDRSPPEIGTIEPIAPSPPLATPGDVGPFIEWFTGIRGNELPEAIQRIAPVVGNDAICQSAVGIFQQKRAAGLRSSALMTLAFLGEMKCDSGMSLFEVLIGEPLPPNNSHHHHRDRTFVTEFGYRMKAIHGLGNAFSNRGDTALMNVIFNHSNMGLRREAVRTYLLHATESVREDLRDSLQGDDKAFVDVVESGLLTGPEFDAQYEAFRQKYNLQ